MPTPFDPGFVNFMQAVARLRRFWTCDIIWLPDRLIMVGPVNFPAKPPKTNAVNDNRRSPCA